MTFKTALSIVQVALAQNVVWIWKLIENAQGLGRGHELLQSSIPLFVWWDRYNSYENETVKPVPQGNNFYTPAYDEDTLVSESDCPSSLEWHTQTHTLGRTPLDEGLGIRSVGVLSSYQDVSCCWGRTPISNGCTQLPSILLCVFIGVDSKRTHLHT